MVIFFLFFLNMLINSITYSIVIPDLHGVQRQRQNERREEKEGERKEGSKRTLNHSINKYLKSW